MVAFDEALRSRATAHLASFDRREARRPDLKQAAVALVIQSDEAVAQPGATFLLTRRAAGLRSHPGQWSLPGGRLEGGEGPIDAARREVEEELGMSVAPADVLGLLDDYSTRSGYVMTPVVLWSSGSAQLAPNPEEVESVLAVPLAELDHPESPQLVAIPESEAPVIRMRIGDRWINAPTAAILYQFREVVLHGRSTRVDHFEQPVWAWR